MKENTVTTLVKKKYRVYTFIITAPQRSLSLELPLPGNIEKITSLSWTITRI